MKQESHRMLGHSLMELLPQQPKRRHTRAFLLGCVEPDCNPLSYLKGSLRSRWFYGHNYQNADRWIQRHMRRLQKKKRWNFWNYYSMGKLIHYTSDAFTYVHNNCFTDTIAAHRDYENQLQSQFLPQLDQGLCVKAVPYHEIGSFFCSVHHHYLSSVHTLQKDCRYIMGMCSWLFCQLIPEASPV